MFYSFQVIRVDLEEEYEKLTKYAQIWRYKNNNNKKQVQPCDQVVQLLDWYERSDCFILVIKLNQI